MSEESLLYRERHGDAEKQGSQKAKQLRKNRDLQENNKNIRIEKFSVSSVPLW